MKTLIRYTRQEFCRESDIGDERLERFLEEEWLRPHQDEELFFDDEDLARARLISELIRDFDLNPDAVSIIMNLLDQIHSLRVQIQTYGRKNEQE